MFFRTVNERGFQPVQIQRLVDEIVKFVFGSRVLDVMHDGFQNVHAEGTWSQLLIKGLVDDPLENGNDSPEFVGVGGDLADCSLNAEVEASLDFELVEFIPNILDHFVQLMQVLLVKPDDISQKISLLFLRFNFGFQFGDLDRVVGGQRECQSCGNEGSNVPLAALTLWNVGRACQKIFEKFENLTDVRFVEFKSAV